MPFQNLVENKETLWQQGWEIAGKRYIVMRYIDCQTKTPSA